MNNLLNKSIRELINNKYNKNDITKVCKEQAKKYSSTNMFIKTLYDQEEIGIPISVKDNFMVKDQEITAASKILQNYISPYNATLVKRLRNNNFSIAGITNMDEFAMGSSGITSIYGPTTSLWISKDNKVFVPGGSSSGSAVSVLSGACYGSFGTDTAGSTRLPAAWCGLVGFKPTYGLFSRFGVIPLSESLDHPSLITRRVDDSRYLFEKLVGKDDNDLTTIDFEPQNYSKKKKFAIIKELYECDKNLMKALKETEDLFINLGYEKIEISLKEVKYALSIYHIICPIEASSNLQKYDTLRYGPKNTYHDSQNLEEIYQNVRTNLFGLEVKRRLINGTLLCSLEENNNLYKKAKLLRMDLFNAISKIFEIVDFILAPTTNIGALTLEESQNANLLDPIKMYKCDMYTVISNLCGIPSINIPVSFDERGSPIGLQVIGGPLMDNHVLNIGEEIEKIFQFYRKIEEGFYDK
ncbi:hypothetical protein AB836_02190 [Rickettsiales bacterium (ex Bugula neritina AB1)]|nr:hypothetical protein AB836_02190 [Rickettsiales bacterium (ex Bugula neritina AB1)]